MKKFSLAAIAVAVALALAPSVGQATGMPKMVPHKSKVSGNGSSVGKYVVGCIFGSALATIGTALRVSRTENRQLTQDEAATAMSFCGLGAFALYTRPAPAAAPTRVVARY
jgi:hypothetical protein